MGSKLLQGVGILAIVGLVGGSIAALAVVKERIHVTIAAEEAAAQRGPDPVELLRADLGAVAGDVAALNKNLGAAFVELHDSLETSATERERKLAARVDALETRLNALQTASSQNSAALAAAINAQSEALRADSAARAENAAGVAPVVVAEIPPAVVTPPAPEVAPPPTAAAPPAGPAKKGFLAFDLPSSAFAFDQRQRFAIVPSLSRVGFDAKSTLHDFSGVTTKVDGNFSVNLAQAGLKPLGTIMVEAKSLDTGLADRDVDMRKTLGVEQFKTMSFEWTGFTATAVDAKAMTVAGNATGKLTIRGKSRDVSMPVKVSVDASKRVAIDGELTIKLSDYGVVPPSQLGVIKVEDELKLWIALHARLLGPAKEGE